MYSSSSRVSSAPGGNGSARIGEALRDALSERGQLGGIEPAGREEYNWL